MQFAFEESSRIDEIAILDSDDQWQLSIRLADLQRCGLTVADVRILVFQGLIGHAIEKKPKGGRRAFKPADDSSLKKRSCFVLTELGRQFIASGCAPNFLSCPEEQKVLFDQPAWNGEINVLSVAGRVVKRFRWPAENQTRVLAAFEEEGWKRIDNPLPSTVDVDSMSRLRDTIKSLNRNQKHELVKFTGDGTGQGVCWKFTKLGQNLLRDISNDRPEIEASATTQKDDSKLPHLGASNGRSVDE